MLALDDTTAMPSPASRAAARYRREPSNTVTPSSRRVRWNSAFLRLPTPQTVSWSAVVVRAALG